MQQKGLDFGEEKPAGRRGWSVSELTERIQGLLETEFFDCWVEGEVSNFRPADSGHWYFSLKDDRAQVRAVVWKTQARLIKFRPKDGLKVLARGGVRVYAPRGEYQLSVEVLEPLGKGSLQQAFEELKEKLQKEGLFDPARKRPLPMLPRRIGVVTSPTGAVIRDILRVLRGRYRNVEVLLFPARVQGEGAAGEVAQGIRALNRLAGLDVLIVARGGGSLEDLQAFNDEAVARALAASRIPTISAVGHETDFTIADFVADLRAATPSAAAQQVVKARADLEDKLTHLEKAQESALRLRFARIRARLQAVTSHRVFEAERGRIRNLAQRTDELQARCSRALERQRERSRDLMRRAEERLAAFHFERQLRERRERIGRHAERLVQLLRGGVGTRRAELGRAAGQLDSLSPLAVLQRGYALAFAGERLVRSASDVREGDALRIRLHAGALGATVTSREN